MTTTPHPQLSHVGLYVRDIAAMEEFYTKVVGLLVSDRGTAHGSGADFVFMTAQPGTHHQFVIATGRPPHGMSTVNQSSFRVRNLDELKEIYHRMKATHAPHLRTVSHGNALSIYGDDPEGNMVEIYMDTEWHVPQPHMAPIDLERSNHEILAWNERHCRATPGFMPMAAYADLMAARLEGRTPAET